MDRRTFLSSITLGLLAVPLAAKAQTGKTFRVGFLTAYSSSAEAVVFESFRRGMRELGYEERRNVLYEARWAEGKLEHLPALAAELVELRMDVMAVANTPSVAAAKRATTTIPIVMMLVGDPVATGLVDSLARPGGNITGLSTAVGELTVKRLELLKEAVPRLSRVAALGQPGDPVFAVQMRHLEAAARSLRVEVFPVELRAVSELDRAFETIVKQRADGVLRLGDALVAPGRHRTIELATKHRLPMVSVQAGDAEAGFLMAYAANRTAQAHQAATHVDKILKGARPRDLPVEQPTTFDLVINLRTAKALGLAIPQALLQRADQVIE